MVRIRIELGGNGHKPPGQKTPGEKVPSGDIFYCSGSRQLNHSSCCLFLCANADRSWVWQRSAAGRWCSGVNLSSRNSPAYVVVLSGDGKADQRPTAQSTGSRGLWSMGRLALTLMYKLSPAAIVIRPSAILRQNFSTFGFRFTDRFFPDLFEG